MEKAKVFWSGPNITEIEVKMTEDSKVGTGTDIYSTQANGLEGLIIKGPGCCS